MATGAFGAGLEYINGAPPERSYLGGSELALRRQREQLSGFGQSGTALGTANAEAGAGMIGTAAGQAPADRQNALGYAQGGQMLGQQGVLQQNQSLGNARGFAAQNTDSLAQLQLAQNMGQLRSGMMANASQARGGNQAAAMRNAQAQGAMMGLQTNQQAAMLRAQEQQAALGRRIAVEQMAAGIGGQQAGLGYGMQGQGLGMAQQSTGMLGQLGAQQGNLGLGQQQAGLGAYGVLNDANKAQLDADRGASSAEYLAGSPYGALAAFGSAYQSFGGSSNGGK